VTASVATLGERALRRLGVAVVPVADRPPLNTRLSPAAIATNALVELGEIATAQVPLTQAAVVPSDTIATLALTKLGVIASDETPSTPDMTLAQNAVAAVHANLVAQGIADWTSAAITSAVSEEYAALAALHMASSFGRQPDAAMLPVLEQRIAAVSRIIRAQNLALAKVQAVQASLTAQANVFWDDTGIPTSVAEEYTRLTAIALASSFGKQADPSLIPALEARVKRASMVYRAPTDAQDAVMAVHNDLSARGRVRWSVWDIPPAAEEPYVVKAANLLAPLFDMPADARSDVAADIALARMIALESSGELVRADYF
jgi:hypothetical protein